LITGLYPYIDPYNSGMLDLDGHHTMYWEESGNPEGVPVVFLHGGPGAGSNPSQRRFFDPKKYRIIIFDQRGAGRSTPYGSLENNTTPHLVSDMEVLREMLGVDSWYVFGGSWGSTLALAYAQSHPEVCRGLILRGIFLCRDSEFEWFLDGVKAFFPEEHRKLVEFLPENERYDILGSYHRRLTDSDPAIHMPAARVWSVYEGSMSTLLPNEGLVRSFERDEVALGLARVEAHYFTNRIFIPEGLLAGIDKIRHIPCWIVQGRYDAVCPIVSADDLVRAWPEAQYTIVNDAGHSAFEPGIAQRLVDIMDSIDA